MRKHNVFLSDMRNRIERRKKRKQIDLLVAEVRHLAQCGYNHRQIIYSVKLRFGDSIDDGTIMSNVENTLRIIDAETMKKLINV